MLTIISGVPGSGKTLWTVDQILNNPDYKDRPVYVNNLDGFDYSIRSNLFSLEDAKTWNDLPEKSVIIFDEAQFAFPVRPANQTPPPWVDAFSVHRHKGYDVIMTSQHPTMIDGHIRKLCGRHLHFLRVFGLKSCTIFEWPEYRTDNIESSARRKMSINKRWQYPKKVFGAYKSADAHTHGLKIPRKVFMIPVFFLGAAVAGYYLFQDLHSGNLASLGTKKDSSMISPSTPPNFSMNHSVHVVSAPAPRLLQLQIVGRVSSGSRDDFVVILPSGDYVLVPRSRCSPDLSNWHCMVGGAMASLITASASPSPSQIAQ